MHRLARWVMGTLVVAVALGVAVWALGSLWPGLGLAGALIGAAAALWGFHRLLLRAEDRGWIYYRRKRGSHGGLGVTAEFLNMYDPSRRHLQETVRKQEWERDEDDEGGGDPGDRDGRGRPAGGIGGSHERTDGGPGA